MIFYIHWMNFWFSKYFRYIFNFEQDAWSLEVKVRFFLSVGCATLSVTTFDVAAVKSSWEQVILGSVLRIWQYSLIISLGSSSTVSK